MRILIDLQGAQGASRYRGIGRYSMSIAKSISKNKGKHEIFVLLNEMLPDSIDFIKSELLDLLPIENIVTWTAPKHVNPLSENYKWRRDAAKILRSSKIKEINPDAVLITSPFEGFGDDAVHSVDANQSWINAAIQYDLIPLIEKDKYLDPNPKYKEFYLQNIELLKKCDVLLAISEFTKNEASEMLGTPESNIFNIGAAVDDFFRPIEKKPEHRFELKKKFGINKDFILYTGATDERKNHARLIEAFSLIDPKVRNKYQLVIAGRLPNEHKINFYNYALNHGIPDTEFVVTGEVTDNELLALYNYCSLYVFPSWHEGFGLPALEAAKCGAPVIGSNTSSLPEVIGNPDALFNPFDPTEISLKILEVLSSNDFSLSLQKNALAHSEIFSWDNCAKEAIKALENTHKDKKLIHNNFDPSTEISNIIYEISIQDASSTTTQEILELSQSIARNINTRKNKVLFIDISELVHRDAKSGIQRVVRSILLELTKSPPQGYSVEPVYALNNETGYRYATNFCQRNSIPTSFKSQCDNLIDAYQGDVFIGLDLQHHVVIHQTGYYSHLRNLGVKIYFVVYDLLPILLPEFFPDGTANIHSAWLNSLSHSDGLLCISKSVADEAIDWLDVYGPENHLPLNIGYFHLGADVSNSLPTYGMPENSQHVLNSIRSRTTFLSVGTIEPRKGHLQTLLAFEELWSENLNVNLVFIGKAGWKVDSLISKLRSHPELNKRLFWLEGVSDEYLETLYQASSCLIAASEGEGFGLPLIEAAQHKLPVIARDIPVFREVSTHHAFYFTGKNAKGLASSIKDWLALYSQNSHPSSDEMPWISWSESAKQLVTVAIGNNWYKKWKHPKIKKFWANHAQIGTEVGVPSGKSIYSNKKSGFIMFGPYIALPSGAAKFIIKGQIESDITNESYIDVALKKGSIIIDKFNKFPTKHSCDDVIFENTIDIPEECEDLEVRFWITAEVSVRVDSIEFKVIDSIL